MLGQARHGSGHSTTRLARPATKEVEVAQVRLGAEVTRLGTGEEEVVRPDTEEEEVAAATGLGDSGGGGGGSGRARRRRWWWKWQWRLVREEEVGS